MIYLFISINKDMMTMLCIVQGAGTDNETLIRVIVSRSEVDLVQIKQEFERQFKKTLESCVKVSLLWLTCSPF